ncbi:MAG: thioester reductase domain-containing protein [Deltaproteobacteria bacterium]|nr:thioester reductase domain-containing protein [Deltaproteobacteria bacterium]
MNQPPPPRAAIHSAADHIEGFREWLRLEIAKSADVGYVGADFNLSLSEMGMSSVHVVRLTGEIEKLLGLELDSSFLHDFDHVEDLCQALFRMVEGRKRRAEEQAARLPISIAATFTAEPIEESVRHALSRLGFDPDVRFGRYNQVFQELLSPQSLIATQKVGVSFLLVRFEDWFRYGEATDLAIERTLGDLLDGLRGHVARGAAPTVLALAPHSPATVRRLDLQDKLHALDARLLAGAQAVPGLTVVDLRAIDAQFKIGRVWDEARDKLGHIPFTQACYTAMGTALARTAAAMLMGPAKVIVVDCDNTLWRGVTGEDGPAGVMADGGFGALQRFLVVQQERGKLICLCSKNNEDDVWVTFAAHPEWPLQRHHIVDAAIGWGRKSEGIAAMADRLSLALDSFIFIDDNPMEIDEVSTALPPVLCVQLPEADRDVAGFFAHHWAFDSLGLTAEDRQRTAMMLREAERKEALAAAPSFEDFLTRLEVAVELRPLGEDGLARAAQLTHRTNQFNARKRVLSEAQVAALAAEPGRGLWTVAVRDRFGDYGVIGLLSAAPDLTGAVMVCDTFMMSCRVLGRRVEHSLVRAVAAHAATAGCDRLRLLFEAAPRNAVARSFFGSLGAGLQLDAQGVGAVELGLDEVEAALTAAVDQQAPPSAAASGPLAQSSRAAAAAGFAELAVAGPDVDRVQASIDATSKLTRPSLQTEYVTPRTNWEKKLAAIWRDVLRIDRVGIYDNFFELGGDSLRAAEAFARMWDLGVPDSISLQTIPDPTVAGLAQAVEDVQAGRRPALLADKFSLEDEGVLAEDIRNPGYDVSSYDAPLAEVLLTGGTGYIGAFLIAELLRQTDARVRCLVRAATPQDGLDRIVGNLRRYGLLKPEMLPRISVVLGDLTEPMLGMRAERFRQLATEIDTIFHSAAWVNFVYPYQHLKATNVDSTETVLRLAVAAAPKPIAVHFVSTLGVIMSTGYGRNNPVYEHNPLLYADDLLNGYEQTKYASDKMVWTAFKERGIPGAIYRPGMVGGLSDGRYDKLDEFMPQFLKGCIQLGSWPLLDTTWEMAPIDFVSQSIVHIAKRPKNLNKAYFSLHPQSKTVAEFIEWHRDQGYAIRGLPFDVWKRELLSLGTERLRKNALFPFVDFIRALSEEQVYFPPTDKTQFLAAIADMEFDLPPQLTLLERYTDHFVKHGFYNNLPSGPRSKRANERPKELALAKGARRGDLLDERLRFDSQKVDAAEAYYILWTDPVTDQHMVIRYVLFNGPIEEAKFAEVWCWFRQRGDKTKDVAVRQRYPLGRALLHPSPDVTMEVGPSGFSPTRAWGRVEGPDGVCTWDLQLDMSSGLGVERVSGMDQYDLFPHFQSNGVKMALSGTVVVNGHTVLLKDQIASDGHYWDTKHLKSWSWAHCAQFEGDPDFVFEGIAPRFTDWCQPCVWLTFVYKGEVIRSNLIDALYLNRELDSDLVSWKFNCERGDLRFVCTLQAKPEDQVLIVHPLPDDEFLYTHITYCGDMHVDIERKEGGKWWKFDHRSAKGTASFEVTRKWRNPEVKREFRIVRAR